MKIKTKDSLFHTLMIEVLCIRVRQVYVQYIHNTYMYVVCWRRERARHRKNKRREITFYKKR